MNRGLALALALLFACGTNAPPPATAKPDDAVVKDRDGGHGFVLDAGTVAPLPRDAGVDEAPDAAVTVDASVTPVDCSPIGAHEGWTVCSATQDTCTAVFEDSAGCAAVCASVALPCRNVFEDLTGMCAPDRARAELTCAPASNHQSDYCVCSRDTDRDGMSDDFEAFYGTDPNRADNNGDIDGDGYTNLERYLWWAARVR